MNNLHIVIPDLFLPKQLAEYASKDLSLPALEKMLARAYSSPLNIGSLEAWMCSHFGVDALAIAPLTLMLDGVPPENAYWLRADPIAFGMQRNQLVLQSDIALTQVESDQLCASLNAHFELDDMQFYAPHPQRWYLRLAHAPLINTFSLNQVVGSDMNASLPYGEEALRWHGVLNEIQMLFYEHAVNQARAEQGKASVSGVWFWGGGKATEQLLQPFSGVAGDSELANAFALAAEIQTIKDIDVTKDGDWLLVYEDLRNALLAADIGRWRESVQIFEKDVALPILTALKAGQCEKITLDVLSEAGSRRFVLSRAALMRIWRFSKPLFHYAIEP